MSILKIIIFASILFNSYYGYSQKEMENQDTIILSNVLKDTFRIENSYRQLPKYIKDALNKINGKKFKVTSGAYNETDVINDSRKPNRYLSYIAFSNTIYLVSYIHGGKGKHQHTLVIEARNRAVTRIVNLAIPFHSNLNELIVLLKNKSYLIQNDNEL